MNKYFKTLLVTGVAMLTALGVQATPSGLNNIPTADTAPDLTPVIQVYSLFGRDRRPDHSAGMKIGFGPWEKAFLNSRFEVGVDGHYAPDPVGPAVFQVKYALQPWEKGPAIAIGAANMAVSDNHRSQAGQPFSYVVLSQNVNDWFRLHAGYGLQHNGDTALLGIEKNFNVFEKPLTIRGDAVQIQDQSDWMASVGLMYPFKPWLVMETWANFPVDTGKPTFMLKFNFVLDWKNWKK